MTPSSLYPEVLAALWARRLGGPANAPELTPADRSALRVAVGAVVHDPDQFDSLFDFYLDFPAGGEPDEPLPAGWADRFLADGVGAFGPDEILRLATTPVWLAGLRDAVANDPAGRDQKSGPNPFAAFAEAEVVRAAAAATSDLPAAFQHRVGLVMGRVFGPDPQETSGDFADAVADAVRRLPVTRPARPSAGGRLHRAWGAPVAASVLFAALIGSAVWLTRPPVAVAMDTHCNQGLDPLPPGIRLKADGQDVVFSQDERSHQAEVVGPCRYGHVWLVRSLPEEFLYSLRPVEPGHLKGEHKYWSDKVDGVDIFVVVLTDEDSALLAGRDPAAEWLEQRERDDLQALGPRGPDDPDVLAILRTALGRQLPAGKFDVHARCYRHVPNPRPNDPTPPQEDSK